MTEAKAQSTESDGRPASTDPRYVLKLYVTGTTPNSARAVVNVRKICEDHLEGRYHLEVIDILQRPDLAKGAELIGAPTLVKLEPLPLRRFIGDMSRTDRLIAGLDLA